MRNAFFSKLVELADADPRIELVTGDLGFGAIEPFVERFPDRFTNAGVAEQNMTGLATGLALSGSIVFTYSIANFPTIRCLEQVRNDVCYHRANVKIVAVGGGLAYGALGYSHHATEDLAILRALPMLGVAAPADAWEAMAITEELVGNDGPFYLRLGKTGEPDVHHGPVVLPPGSSITLRDGNDVTLIATGAIVHEGVTAAKVLADRGLDVRIVSMPWIEPFDSEVVVRAARDTPLLVTIEEHSVVGGLGGAVAEVLAEGGIGVPLVRIGLPRQFAAVGSQTYLRHRYGLDAGAIADRVLEALEENHGVASSVR